MATGMAVSGSSQQRLVQRYKFEELPSVRGEDRQFLQEFNQCGTVFAIDRPLTLIIIDNDPIFRLGLVQALSRIENISFGYILLKIAIIFPIAQFFD